MDFCSKGQRDKIKVLFISYNGLLEPLLYSQGIVYLRELTKELNIRTVVLSFEKLSFFLTSEERQKIKRLKSELLSNNIRWYWLRYHKSPAILSSIYDVLAGICVSAYLVLIERIAFIHARSYVPAAIAFVLSKILKIRYIFDMRGFMIEDYVSLGIISEDSLIKRIAKYLERSIFKNASYTILLTQGAYKAISDFIKIKIDALNKIEIIPCCVDTKRFLNFSNKDQALLKSLGLENKCIFIYIGSLGKLYLPDKMLDFFKVAYDAIPNTHFLIITPDLQYMNSEITRYKDFEFSKHISCLKVSPEEIGKYISLGDVGIAFYLPSPSRVGTSPTKIGEYLACGLPIIINEGIGDIGRIIREEEIGAVISDFNGSGYIKGINKIQELIKEPLVLKQRCRKVAEKYFSLDGGIKKYKYIYQKLLEV